jgi:hypothetical protein
MSNFKAQSSNDGDRETQYFGFVQFGFHLKFELWHLSLIIPTKIVINQSLSR